MNLKRELSKAEEHGLTVRNYKLKVFLKSFDLPVNIRNMGYSLWLNECHMPCRIIWDGEKLHGYVTTDLVAPQGTRFEFLLWHEKISPNKTNQTSNYLINFTNA